MIQLNLILIITGINSQELIYAMPVILKYEKWMIKIKGDKVKTKSLLVLLVFLNFGMIVVNILFFSANGRWWNLVTIPLSLGAGVFALIVATKQ